MTHKTIHRRIERFTRALDAPSLDLVGSVEIDEVYVSAGKKGRERDQPSRSRGRHVHAPEVGDRVRIDIPDPTDPDFDRFYGRHGTVVRILKDDAGRATGDQCDSQLYRIELDDGREQDFRWRDLRPALNDASNSP